jgi:hypothetical protein
MMSRFFKKKEAESRPTPKSLQMVWGANHNYFNTEWQSSDAWGCTGEPTHEALFDSSSYLSKKQQDIASHSITAFFRAHVGAKADPKHAQLFDSANPVPAKLAGITRIDRDYMSGFDLSQALLAEDFSRQVGRSTYGIENADAGIKIKHESGATPPVGDIRWETPSKGNFFQTNFAEGGLGNGKDVSKFKFLDFRVGRWLPREPDFELKTSVNFSVQLVSEDNSVSSLVEIAPHSELFGPPHAFTDLTQTVRIPLTEFKNIDLQKVRGVRFVFNQTPSARIRLAHIRFGSSIDASSTPKSFDKSLNGNALFLLDQPDAEDEEGTEEELKNYLAPEEEEYEENAENELNNPVNNTPTEPATWIRTQSVTTSRQLSGTSVGVPAVEITVQTASPGGFPATGDLPVLNIANYRFPVSRYPSSGRLNTLTFSIPENVYRDLPAKGRAQVQYGIKKPSRIWTLPEFTKTYQNTKDAKKTRDTDN